MARSPASRPASFTSGSIDCEAAPAVTGGATGPIGGQRFLPPLPALAPFPLLPALADLSGLAAFAGLTVFAAFAGFAGLGV